MHRVALTPHYDGVIRGHNEPAVIAICGIGPVNFALSDPIEAGLAGGVRARNGAANWRLGNCSGRRHDDAVESLSRRGCFHGGGEAL